MVKKQYGKIYYGNAKESLITNREDTAAAVQEEEVLATGTLYHQLTVNSSTTL